MGITPFVVGGDREVGEHKVDLSLLCKVSWMILSIKKLDMATILGYFYMKVFYQKSGGNRIGRKMALPFPGIQ